MAAPAQRIVTVVHATGKQGSGVVHALLRSGKYHVKAVTRDANTDSARLASHNCLRHAQLLWHVRTAHARKRCGSARPTKVYLHL